MKGKPLGEGYKLFERKWKMNIQPYAHEQTRFLSLSTYQLFYPLLFFLQRFQQTGVIGLTHRNLFMGNSNLVALHLIDLIDSYHERPVHPGKLMFRQLIDHFQEGTAG